MFDYFYKQTAPDCEWTPYVESPDTNVKYKQEEGCTLISILSECIVEAPLINVLCLFAEIDVFQDWMPDMTEAVNLKPVTDFRGLYRCRQAMPWPIWPRDMIISVTGMFDKEKKAVLIVIRSPEED